MRDPRWLIAACLACSASGVGCHPAKDATAANLSSSVVAAAAESVEVGRPVVRTVKDYEDFTGHTDAILNIEIKSRVTGYLDKRNFKEGDEVKEGDVLYEIDPRPYQSMMDRAESMVARAEAHLNRLGLDYRRSSNLFQRGAIGKQEFDLIASDHAEAEAAVHVANAERELARQSLDWTKIRAPMSGQISETRIDPGNLVRQGVTVLTDIVAADQLYVYFDLSPNSLERVRTLIDQGHVEKGPGKEVAVLVGLSDAEGLPEAESFPYRGTVNFSENRLDAATGTLRIRGIIANPRPWILSPGLFVRVRLPVGTPHTSVLVKREAVASNQGRTNVFVVGPDDVVESRPVDVGPAFEGYLSIRHGLAAGERIIVDPEGMQRVRAGNKVAPRERDPAQPDAKKAKAAT